MGHSLHMYKEKVSSYIIKTLSVTLYMVRIIKSAYKPSGPSGPSAYPGFCSMKQLGVFLLLPRWDVSPSQG